MKKKAKTYPLPFNATHSNIHNVLFNITDILFIL